LKKKVLIHSIVFSPDGVSTAYLYNDIALKFKENGYDVTVLTTTPHYNVLPDALKKQPMQSKLFGLFYESNFKGIKVLHVPQKKFKQTSLRILGFVYWHILSFFLGLFEKRVDVIISPSPPLSIGLINIILSKLTSSKVIYNVQEIYPDFLIKQGSLKSKPVISILKWVERVVYNQSDIVITIDSVFYDSIVYKFTNKSKLRIIPNFVDTDLYKPMDPGSVILDKSLFPDNPETLKVMYAGNIGHAQDWKPLIEAAIQLKEEAIEFFIIGEGVLKEFVESQVVLHNLKKVHVLPYQPRELMPSLIAYSDIQFIFMAPEMEANGFPSKVYTIMACAKPLLVCSGKDTPIYKFLNDKNCAYLIQDRELATKVEKIVSILRAADKDTLKKMGSLGLHEINTNYSKHQVTIKYVNLVEGLLNGQ
jgi:colanic acid biosynthesis glycosyl transferase WcaI